MKAPACEGVMSGQFSGLVDKWKDSSLKAGVSVERGRRMTAIIGTGRVCHLWSPSGSITPIFTAVFAPSPSSSYSSLSLLEHKTLAVCSLSPLTPSLYKYSHGISVLQEYTLKTQQKQSLWMALLSLVASYSSPSSVILFKWDFNWFNTRIHP